MIDSNVLSLSFSGKKDAKRQAGSAFTSKRAKLRISPYLWIEFITHETT
jgi:hypothetical protein